MLGPKAFGAISGLVATVLLVCTYETRLLTRIHRLALQGKHAENGRVYPVERLTPDETYGSFRLFSDELFERRSVKWIAAFAAPPHTGGAGCTKDAHAKQTQHRFHEASATFGPSQGINRFSAESLLATV
jgi:hypothetical protein